MKRTHKGFTLVELLIVVAVIGVLAVMMTMSSSEAVDVAGANAIMGNLQTMKTAAYQMYMHEPAVGFMDITWGGTNTIADTSVAEAARETVETVLKKYLGKDSTSTVIGSTQYGLVGNKTAWYVVYKLATTDTDGVKAKLAANAKKAELLGASGATIGDFVGKPGKEAVYAEDDPDHENDPIEAAVDPTDGATYYANSGETYVALKVR